ncbi:MAG TPA: ABC transporter permease [Anaerolineae bacterium]|nr:ABC transporter permease [Anaerolineae bacterium]
MIKIWLVTKHEIGVILRQRSFWLVTVLLPILLVGLQATTLIRETGIGDAVKSAEESAQGTQMPAIGLVDPAGLMAHFPPNLGQDWFVRYPDEAAARADLEAGRIDQLVSVPADYLAGGQVAVYDKGFQVLRSGSGLAFSSDTAWLLDYILGYNLTGDAERMAALRNPTPGELASLHELNPPAAAGTENQEMAGLVSSLVPYAFYFLLVMGASYLTRSVVAEKENRTAEVLLVSLDPKQLMFGKIAAMSLLVAVQAVIWVGGGALALDRGADLLKLGQFEFPPGFLVWALLFLVLGYLLFAAVMAAAGAIANSAREAGQTIWLLVIPLMPTLMFGSEMIEKPGSPLVLFLSFFPFSSPSAMVTRLAVQAVPAWQIGLSLALLAGTTYAAVVLAARFFRSGNLLSGESFSWKRFVAGWRGQRAD